MDISSNFLNVSGINGNSELAQNKINTKVDASAFGNLYDAALNLYEDTNTLQVAAEQEQTNYITGKTDNMLSVMMAQEKAYTSLNFTVQVTTKVIEAYREIMRIQI